MAEGRPPGDPGRRSGRHEGGVRAQATGRQVSGGEYGALCLWPPAATRRRPFEKALA